MIESPEKFDPAEKFGILLDLGVDSEWDECTLLPETVLTRLPRFFWGISIAVGPDVSEPSVATLLCFSCLVAGEEWRDSADLVSSEFWLEFCFRLRNDGTLKTPFTIFNLHWKLECKTSVYLSSLVPLSSGFSLTDVFNDFHNENLFAPSCTTAIWLTRRFWVHLYNWCVIVYDLHISHMTCRLSLLWMN